MKKFTDFIKEEKGDNDIVFIFGRMNPPTKGHQEMIEFAAKLAKQNGAELRIYSSRTEDNDKNPLSYDIKMSILKKIFPKYNFIKSYMKILNPYKIIEMDLAKYNNIWFVVGGDREERFTGEMTRYPNVKVVSSGQRTAGVSASDLRQAIKDDDFSTFRKGLPMGTPESIAEQLYFFIQKKYSQGKKITSLKEEKELLSLIEAVWIL